MEENGVKIFDFVEIVHRRKHEFNNINLYRYINNSCFQIKFILNNLKTLDN